MGLNHAKNSAGVRGLSICSFVNCVIRVVQQASVFIVSDASHRHHGQTSRFLKLIPSPQLFPQRVGVDSHGLPTPHPLSFTVCRPGWKFTRRPGRWALSAVRGQERKCLSRKSLRHQSKTSPSMRSSAVRKKSSWNLFFQGRRRRRKGSWNLFLPGTFSLEPFLAGTLSCRAQGESGTIARELRLTGDDARRSISFFIIGTAKKCARENQFGARRARRID